MKPIMDFIAVCPFLDDYGIDLGNMGAQLFTASKPDTSMLLYSGSVLAGEIKDVQRTRTCNRQANYQLFLLRRAGYDSQRCNASNFLFNFEQWVEACQFQGLCPKLSLDEDSRRKEVMWADNAAPYSEWEDGLDSSLYQIQLHISYYNTYINKEGFK